MKFTQSNVDRHDWGARASEALENAKSCRPDRSESKLLEKRANYALLPI
jgi:hypothetical protein